MKKGVRCCFPVEFHHSFSSPEKILEAMLAADFYIGITAASSLMSESEIRTGEEEARLAGIRLLRKATPATVLRRWIPGKDFLDVDSLEPDKAADTILAGGQSYK